MKIYDTYDGKIKEFVPVEKGKVRMYVCGLTPYDDMHVGHLRTSVFFDVVRRYLEHIGYEVIYVQNITDVEDKLFNRANELGIPPLKLAEKNMSKALKEMDAANIKRPTLLEKVSENITAIINIIKKIMENGYAYASNGEVYFSVAKFRNYGRLSKQKIDQLMSGTRVEVNKNKKSPLDFALWKKSKKNELEYESPWGDGRPGWHIECSAISTKYLGKTIDIHGGGRDLIFPHHENEIAQSESAYGQRFVNYWMHTGFLTIKGEKMSKSLGNFITAGELLKKYDANVIRWYLLTRHYRSPIDFEYLYFDEVKTHIERISQTIEFSRVFIERGYSGKNIDEEISSIKADFHISMQNDFDTPSALGKINEIVHVLNREIKRIGASSESVRRALETLTEMLGVLGIQIPFKSDEEYLNNLEEMCEKHKIGSSENLYAIVDSLLGIREKLRKDKKYEEADLIRKQLEDAGIIVEDIAGDAIWRRG